MFDYQSIREHLHKKAALFNGVPLDYVSLHGGARYNAEFARVVFGSRPVAESIDEVIDQLADAADEAQQEGATSLKVRAKFWRGRAPAGSRVYATEGAPSDEVASVGATREEVALARDSELVAVVRELRMVSTAMAADLTAQSHQGYRMAAELMRELREVQVAKMKADLEVKRMELEMRLLDKPDELMAMAREMLPQLAMSLLTRGPSPSPEPPPPPPSLPPTPAAESASSPSPETSSE